MVISSHSDPLTLFAHYFRAPKGRRKPRPDGGGFMTATPDGFPSLRMVLLKAIDDRGLVFLRTTNREKGVS